MEIIRIYQNHAIYFFKICGLIIFYLQIMGTICNQQYERDEHQQGFKPAPNDNQGFKPAPNHNPAHNHNQGFKPAHNNNQGFAPSAQH